MSLVQSHWQTKASRGHPQKLLSGYVGYLASFKVQDAFDILAAHTTRITAHLPPACVAVGLDQVWKFSPRCRGSGPTWARGPLGPRAQVHISLDIERSMKFQLRSSRSTFIFRHRGVGNSPAPRERGHQAARALSSLQC